MPKHRIAQICERRCMPWFSEMSLCFAWLRASDASAFCLSTTRRSSPPFSRSAAPSERNSFETESGNLLPAAIGEQGTAMVIAWTTSVWDGRTTKMTGGILWSVPTVTTKIVRKFA
ncbi:hypothetical protein [Bradyrhizobium brasilense]|uniref:Uncharacterized protein n=1 Tax=Bradyrhizobium brasilense TaxID=1419277 RepID=A0A1G7IWQ9_9BRAD|nr:hypothetical protein [Bradyrhizobium brasilense]MCC8976331.1 hypothetical protein [Bradyrhizobium brasilense]SDF17117.1 hypothetical protein SAMN05216337_104658 [Bradyrhizobium brasilense]